MTDLQKDFVERVHPLPTAAQLAFAASAELAPHLCKNPAVTSEAWSVLWDQHLESFAAKALVSRPLTDEQLLTVLTTEKRSGVLVAALSFNSATRVPLEVLRRIKGTPPVAAQIFEAFSDNQGLLDEFGPLLPPVLRLRWLATAPTVTDDFIVNELITLPQWWGKTKLYGQRSMILKNLFVERPTLVTRLANLPSEDATAAALAASKDLLNVEDQIALLGNPVTISKFAQLASANNPRTHQEVLDILAHSNNPEVVNAVTRRRLSNRPTVSEPYSEVVDLGTLVWLVSRATPSTFEDKYSPGKMGELLDLAHNPELTLEMADSLAKGIIETDDGYSLQTKVAAAKLALAALFPRLTDKYNLTGEEALYTPTPYHRDPVHELESLKASFRALPTEQFFIKYQYDIEETLIGDLLTPILGETSASWTSLVLLISEHQNLSLFELAKTARRLNA